MRLLLAASLLLAAPVALAVSPTFDQATDQAWAEAPRVLSVVVTQDTFSVDSARNDTTGTDTILVAFDAEAARLSMRLEARSPAVADVAFNWTLERVVEFRDEDGDGGFGLGDPVVQGIRIADLQRGAIGHERLPGDRHQFTATYFAVSTNARITLEALVAPTPAAETGPVMDPVAVALRLRFERFPFQETGTHLALLGRLDAAMVRTGGQLAGEDGPVWPYFAWAPFAANGTSSAPATVTSERYTGAEESVVLALAYPRGEAIEHEITAGFARPMPENVIETFVEEELRDRWPTYLAGATLATMFVLLLVYGPWGRRP